MYNSSASNNLAKSIDVSKNFITPVLPNIPSCCSNNRLNVWRKSCIDKPIAIAKIIKKCDGDTSLKANLVPNCLSLATRD